MSAGSLRCIDKAETILDISVFFCFGATLFDTSPQFLSSMCSAVAATILSCPADVLKSRMQNADPGTYRGLMDCARVLIKSEGVLALWKGAIPVSSTCFICTGSNVTRVGSVLLFLHRIYLLLKFGWLARAGCYETGPAHCHIVPHFGQLDTLIFRKVRNVMLQRCAFNGFAVIKQYPPDSL